MKRIHNTTVNEGGVDVHVSSLYTNFFVLFGCGCDGLFTSWKERPTWTVLGEKERSQVKETMDVVWGFPMWRLFPTIDETKVNEQKMRLTVKSAFCVNECFDWLNWVNLYSAMAFSRSRYEFARKYPQQWFQNDFRLVNLFSGIPATGSPKTEKTGHFYFCPAPNLLGL